MPRHNRGLGEAEDGISDDEEEQEESLTQTPEQRSEQTRWTREILRARDIEVLRARDMEVLRDFVAQVNTKLAKDKRLSLNDSLPKWFCKRPSPLQQTPSQLDERDNRFGKRKRRMFVCDSLGCGNLVKRSSYLKKGGKYSRRDCEFAGGWVDASWAEIPGEFQKKAWELGLIDATWRCSQFCQQPPTGQGSSSMKRAQEWAAWGSQQKQKKQKWRRWQ